MNESSFSTLRPLRNISLATLCAFGLSNCTTNPFTGEQQASKSAVGAGVGTLIGAGLGALIGEHDGNAGKGALIGAGVGFLGGLGVGQYMDQQEALIRNQLQGTGVSVTRQGNNIILNMPQDITFGVGQDSLRPEMANTLDSVALVLNKYEKTLVSVQGHTDSDGSKSYNQNLSERRALGVANYLASRQVNAQRLGTQGYGESQPIASNANTAGKSQNRRVEVHIVPQG